VVKYLFSCAAFTKKFSIEFVHASINQFNSFKSINSTHVKFSIIDYCNRKRFVGKYIIDTEDRNG